MSDSCSQDKHAILKTPLCTSSQQLFTWKSWRNLKILMQRFIIPWQGKHYSQCHRVLPSPNSELLISLLDTTTCLLPLLLALTEATAFNLIHPEATTESAADIQLVLVGTWNYCFVKNVNILTFVAILRVERNCIFIWKFWNVTLKSQIQLWILEFHLYFILH